MHTSTLSRRDALKRTTLLFGVAAASHALESHSATAEPGASASTPPFRFCLNTATIRGQKLGIVKEIEIAAQAGYTGIEPWVESVQDYARNGGSLSDLRKRVSDAGLTVEGAIGFAEWVVDDEERRARGLERIKREMDLMAQIGGRRFAAPPAGATDLPKLDPLKAAERYRALLELGDQLGIQPQLELWGFSKNLNRLSECVAIAMETAHPKACVLADVFHMYKGGSVFEGLGLLGPNTVPVLHMNDYPSDPPREKINDGFRVYPGEGSAPITQILRALRQAGCQKVLSLELFSSKYWSQDPLDVAKTGLAKLKAAAERALA